MLLNQAERVIDLAPGKPDVLRQFDCWIKPEFGFTVLPLNMHVHPRFFSRKEIEAKTGGAEDCRTHARNDTRKRSLCKPARGQ